MAAYYNEIDPRAAAWLRELIRCDRIAPGEVDERSIEDVSPDDLVGFDQCHFFAGIGGWSLALRSADISDNEPLWTGSCPCQPFSSAGKSEGFADERHLWPAWFHLIGERRPPVIFGEQVASKAAEPWIDLVHADLESVDYAFGCDPFPSAGVGAPHIRDRTFWVAESGSERLSGLGLRLQPGQPRFDHAEAGRRGEAGRMADDAHKRHERGWPPRRRRDGPANLGAARGLGDPARGGCGVERDAALPRSGGHPDGADQDHRPGPTNGYWRAADWLNCTDGKWRPVEPSTFPLAHGLQARLVRLRGYGNAINAEAAREFIEAYIEAVN